MPELRSPRRSAVLAVLLGVLVAALFARSVWEERQRAERRIGATLDVSSSEIVASEMVPGGPADLAGLADGDILRAVDGMPVPDFEAYDRATRRIHAGIAVLFEVERNGQPLELRLLPGQRMRWGFLLCSLLVALASLAVAIPTLLQRPDDLRARLLFTLLALIACEFVFPTGVDDLSTTLKLYFLVHPLLFTGLQMAIDLHLASVLPKPQAWLERRPWIIAAFYTIGLGFGLAQALTYAAEHLLDRDIFPWSVEQIDSFSHNALLPSWALTVTGLLGAAAWRHPRRKGRLQAGLVLLGMLPWAIYALTFPILALLGLSPPGWIETLVPFLVLAYPAAVFMAIFRHQLFDLEVVVRRSMIYATLSATLVLIFYAALGAGGWFFTELAGDQVTGIWVMAAATLILGLLFAPLRRASQRFIDRRFFPGRLAMRQRLVDLIGELPALGGLHRMGERLTERLAEIFTATSATVLLTDPKSKILISLAARREGRGPHTSMLLLRSDDPGIARLHEHGRPLPVAELESLSPSLAHSLRRLRPRLAVPMLHESRLIGVFFLGRKASGRSYVSEERELLSLVAHHVAIVFENVRLFQSATYEGLTGLLRREAILDLLQREIDRAERYGRPLAVALADLDHFKNTNDRFGHLEGDRVLRRVAEELSNKLRSSDAVGRYGGEEFLLVFPETDLDNAVPIAEKLRQAIEGIELVSESGAPIPARISIGLASLSSLDAGSQEPGKYDTRQRLLAAADRELYRAKDAGRNRVEPQLSTETMGC